MKKLLFVLGLVMMNMTVMAQEEKSELPDGVLALEWKFNPFDYESKPVKVAEVTARLFLNNKSVVRLGVGVGFDKDKDENNTSNSNSVLNNDALTLKVGLGYEYHFANTGRLDFYAGAEGGYLGRFYSATSESSTTTVSGQATIIDYTNIEYRKQNSGRDKCNENGFYGTVFTGIDFYVYKKLYIGAELGLTFNTATKKSGSYTQVQGRKTILDGSVRSDDIINYTVSEPDHTGTTTKVYLEPAIRIGWMF